MELMKRNQVLKDLNFFIKDEATPLALHITRVLLKYHT